jgi:hypothetical protein
MIVLELRTMEVSITHMVLSLHKIIKCVINVETSKELWNASLRQTIKKSVSCNMQHL